MTVKMGAHWKWPMAIVYVEGPRTVNNLTILHNNYDYIDLKSILVVVGTISVF